MISSLAEIRKPFRKASLHHLPELDNDVRTLHIRCGDDLEKKLAIAGFVGDFLHFSDPYVQSEIPNTDSVEDFIEIRAEQISKAYNQSFEEVKLRLQAEYEGLRKAKEYPRVVMWFEHDPHDQLILARLLSWFADLDNRPEKLELLCVSKVRGIRRFTGLGQLSPEVLHYLWEDRQDVSEAQYELGAQAWQAIRSSSPKEMSDLVSVARKDMPIMAEALQRFLRELPSSVNGLSLSEELTLKILRDKGDLNAAQLFEFYNSSYEPMVFMGDSSYWVLLEGLACARQPAIRLVKDSSDPAYWHVGLTATGFTLLHNNVDWLMLNHIVRWVGGVLIDSSKYLNWRCQRDTGAVFQL